MRACWAAPDAVVEAVPGGGSVGSPAGSRAWNEPEGRRPRTFVPVEELTRAPEPASLPVPPAVPVAAPAPGWSLWGDQEP